MTTAHVMGNDTMKVITISCAFDNFSYLLICNETGQVAVVDPTEAYPVWREVEAAEGELAAVLCTHHHHDHIGGLEDLLAEQPDLAVYGYTHETSRIPFLTDRLGDGASIAIGRLTGRALHTPGHTAGSMCYLFGDRLFTGDTLFGAGCGRLFEGTAEQLYTSLNSTIAGLPDETWLYFGHEYTKLNLRFAAQVEPGNEAIGRRMNELQQTQVGGGHSTPSSIGVEKATNPFLRCASAVIRNQFPGSGVTASDVEIFSLLRTLRNGY